MKTKRYTQILSAALLCAALTFFTVAQADITIKIDGTDTQWTLTETELQQAPTLQAYIEDPTKRASSAPEVVLPNNEHTQELTLVMPYLQLASQLRNGTRPETGPIAAALEVAVIKKPESELGTLQEKEAKDLLALANAAHYWGVMPVGNIVVEHLGRQLCDIAYITRYFQNPRALPADLDTRKRILKKIYQNSPAFSYWLMQDQILNNPARDGQVPCKTFNHGSWVNSAVFNNDDSQILTFSADNARLWNTKNGELIHSFNHTASLRSAVFNHDCTKILTESDDNTVTLWDAKTGTPLCTSRYTDCCVMSTAFYGDEIRALTVSVDGNAKLCDGATGTILYTLQHTQPVRAGFFNHDATKILTTYEGGVVKLWDAVTGQLIHTLNHAHFNNIAVFSPDGTHILIPKKSSYAMTLWDTASGDTVRVFNSNSLVLSAVFNHDGTQILTVLLSNNTAELWNASTGKLIHAFDHANTIMTTLFNHDESHIITASHDRTTKLWHTRTGKLIHAFNHPGWVNSAVGNHDGTQVLTASWDSTARLWDIADQALQNYVLQQMGLEQAALLVLAYDCTRKNVPLNLLPKARNTFEKLDPRLQAAVRSLCTVNFVHDAAVNSVVS